VEREEEQMKVKLLFLLSLFFVIGTADAHHIRGIPHYSYQDNYPQAPLIEEFRDTADLTLQFTFWQIPGQRALDLALYAKNRATGKPYTGDVSFQVFKRGDAKELRKNHPFLATPNKRNIYKVGWVYEEDGVYFAEVSLGEGDQAVTETFRFQVGKVPPNYWLLGGIVGLVICLMIFVAIAKRKSD
jgi:hypothetical protein